MSQIHSNQEVLPAQRQDMHRQAAYNPQMIPNNPKAETFQTHPCHQSPTRMHYSPMLPRPRSETEEGSQVARIEEVLPNIRSQPKVTLLSSLLIIAKITSLQACNFVYTQAMRQVRTLLTRPLILFACILIVAGTFRLPLMQYVEFKGDEAINLLLATRPLFHHPFPPASQPSSAGILNFPLINYLLFPIVIFTTYPPTISFIIALLNTLAVGGYFLLFAKYHGKLVGFLSAIIIALSPWTILYSRKIWAQDFLLPLGLPFFLSVYKVMEGKKKYWMLFGTTSILLLQIHQVAILIPLLIFASLLFQKQKVAWKYLCGGIFLGILPAVPYFYYMATSYCFGCQTNASLIARFTFHNFTTFLRPLQILSIGNFHTEFGNDFALFATQLRLFYQVSKIAYLAYLFLPIGATIFFLKNKTYRFYVLVSSATVLIFFMLGIEPLMHYYILLVPFFALFLGFFLAYLMHWKKLWAIGVGVSVLFLLSLGLFDIGFLQLLAQKGGLAGDYGAGYILSQQVAEKALKQFTQRTNYEELLLTSLSPREFFHGYMPLGRMLFPYSELKKEEQNREDQFILTPNDPLLQREVFAYYTQSEHPNWPYVIQLKEKARTHIAFDFLYLQVLNEYLSEHFKRLYDTPDFVLLYPEHWVKNEISDGVMLSDGTVAIAVKQILPSNQPTAIDAYTISTTQLVDQTINRGRCFRENTWCGTFYQPLLIGMNMYQFSIKPVEAKDSSETLEKYGMLVFQEINSSIISLR